MLSRRNIRVKAMQAIYAHEQDPEKTTDRLEKTMLENINGAYRALLYNLYLLSKTGEYVNADAEIQAGKFIKTEDAPSVSLFHNPIIQHLVVNEALYNEIQREKLDTRIDRDFFRQWFQLLKKTEEYGAYSQKENPLLSDDREMVTMLYKRILMSSELFQQHLEDVFPTWTDDNEVIFHAVMNYIQTVSPNQPAFLVRDSKDMKEVKQFASDLLRKTLTHENEIEEIITPFLQHWEKERVAMLDMVLMKMAVAELLFFSEIPVKVTINEYIELAKNYSTPKSGEFINGILDAVRKKLTEDGRVKKSGRGAIES